MSGAATSFEKKSTSDERKAEIVREALRMLTVHTYIEDKIRHHVEEEETGWFPKVREALGRKELAEIGARMIAERDNAPTSVPEPKGLRAALDALSK